MKKWEIMAELLIAQMYFFTWHSFSPITEGGPPPFFFVNKVLLAHSHASLCIICGCSHTIREVLNRWHRLSGLQRQKCILSGPSQKKFANPWFSRQSTEQEIKPWLVVFAHFPGVNSPTRAHFKLLTRW